MFVPDLFVADDLDDVAASNSNEHEKLAYQSARVTRQVENYPEHRSVSFVVQE